MNLIFLIFIRKKWKWKTFVVCVRLEINKIDDYNQILFFVAIHISPEILTIKKKIHFIRLSKTDSLIIFIDFILLYLIECFILWYLRIILNLLFVIKYDRCLVFMILSFIINFYNFCNDNNMVLPDYSYTFWF